MNCRKVRRRMPEYNDGRLREDVRADIRLHLAGCFDCAAYAARLDHVRQALRALPSFVPPVVLSTSLRVLAARELASRRSHGAAGALLAEWRLRAMLWLEDMMRPVALPVAGGLLSAVVLFAILVPTFAVPATSSAEDVPTALFTEASVLQMGPFGLSENEIILDLTLDQKGRVIDYSIPSAHDWLRDPQARRNLENMLLLTVFNPSTTFGQPSSGKVRIMLRRSEIDVRG